MAQWSVYVCNHPRFLMVFSSPSISLVARISKGMVLRLIVELWESGGIHTQMIETISLFGSMAISRHSNSVSCCCGNSSMSLASICLHIRGVCWDTYIAGGGWACARSLDGHWSDIIISWELHLLYRRTKRSVEKVSQLTSILFLFSRSFFPHRQLESWSYPHIHD